MMDVAVQAYRRRELQQAVADTQDRTALVHGLLLSPGASIRSTRARRHLDPNGTYLAIRARSTESQRNLLLELGTAGVLEDGAAAPSRGRCDRLCAAQSIARQAHRWRRRTRARWAAA